LLNWRRQAAINAMPGLNPDHTPWHEFWRRFVVSRWRWARVFVLLLIAVAIVAPWIAPFDAENYFDYDRLNDGPSMMHWFGVDSLGRDIFSRVLVGAQISLAAGVLAVLIGAAIGTVLGCWPGITKAGGIASSCASATCCSPSRDPAGDCRGGGDGQRDGERDHCGGDLFDPGLCPPGARQHAGAEAADLY
jgi:hypothetical protein